MSAIKRLAEALNEAGMWSIPATKKKAEELLRTSMDFEFDWDDTDYNSYKVIHKRIPPELDHIYLKYDLGVYEPEKGKTYDYYWENFYNGDYTAEYVYRFPNGKEVTLDIDKDDSAYREALRFLVHNLFEPVENWEEDDLTGGRSRDTW